jgi:hypothetical protein
LDDIQKLYDLGSTLDKEEALKFSEKSAKRLLDLLLEVKTTKIHHE